MDEHILFELGVAIALVAAAGLIAYKLRFSVVPFYIIVGMLVGPHAPQLGPVDLRFIQSDDLIMIMGQMGVVFLLFYLGLEFSVDRLQKAGRSILVAGSIYLAINFSLGLLFGWIGGFSFKEILVIAGITTVSSSAIVAKVLMDLKRAGNPETELILGTTLFEDVFLAVYLSILSGLILSGATSFGGVLLSALLALGYMLLILFVGRKAVPLLNRALNITSNEVFILVIFALLLLIAGFSETIHVAAAIGALLVGLIIAETEHMKRIEKMILPFRDFFGALFFFSFGLSIDPTTLGDALWLSLGAVLVTLIGANVAGLLAGRSAELSSKASTNIGLTLMARGEFSIIVANLGSAGGLSSILQPFTALYVLIMAMLTPILAKESKRIYQGFRQISGVGKR